MKNELLRLKEQKATGIYEVHFKNGNVVKFHFKEGFVVHIQTISE